MRRVLLTSAVAFLSLLQVTTSFAAIINIPAITFVPRDLASSTTQTGEAFQGLLLNASGRYYAPVVFPSAGSVCSVSVAFRDNDPESNIIVRLLRKGFTVGGNAFTAPVVMASTNSTGASETTRLIEDTSIAQPAISFLAFYYVELVIPANTQEVIGVSIDFRPTACP
jgi:hypothetical protein